MSPRAKTIAAHLNRAPELMRCLRHTQDWLPLALSYTGLRQGKFPYTARFRTGESFEFRDIHDVATWWQIFYRNVYPVEKGDLLIVDAGANVGAFTLYALRRAPEAKVIAIEPFPETFLHLRLTVEASQFRDRVLLVNAALTSHSGWVAMQQAGIGSQFRRVVGEQAGQDSLRVRSKTLFELLESVEGDVDFLKLDIEGSEYSALLRSPIETLQRIRRIAMEFHPLYTPNPPQPRELLAYLESAGFRTEELQEHGEGYGMAYLRRKI